MIYLDDLPILSPSNDKALEEVHVVIQTLKSLGFLVYREKSNLVPSQIIQYLGFKINLVTMIPFLPERKLINLIRDVSEFYNSSTCSIRQSACVIGLIVSSFLAIKPAKLYYWNLEAIKTEALRNHGGSYDAVILLSSLAKQDLFWFVSKARLYNGTKLIRPTKVITLTTDASLSGWGVVSDVVTTNGSWSLEEKSQHINWLELTAIWPGVQCFVLALNCYIKVFCDNGLAVAYINNMGTPYNNLHSVASQIWQ